ncbi:MAG TPA: HAMP domain-containing sensor histidine kinase, partial [Acidimicrobiia bacterium]|nr:HAMP domain-containing sensor histidine kinase [Acidimicrobiia bacterium]
MPILVVEQGADGELHATPNRLAQDLSGGGPPWFPLGHVDGWEQIVSGLEAGESDSVMVIVDDLGTYGRHWNLERDRTSWSVVFSRLGTTTWSVLAHDITGQYRYVEMLEDTLASRERAYELLAQVAHELKQPVTSISGLAQVILEQETNTETAELVGLIGSESASMIALIDDLLTSGLVSSDRMRVNTEASPVGPLLDALQRVASAFLERDIAVRFEGEPDVAVFVDTRRLTQVVRGIVQNAVKYGGPHIEIAATAEADRFVLEVRDDGPGVPTTEVPTIFQPFRTGHSGQRMGTGIGLAVARSIVADMGGLLEYRAGDPGAVFVLTLHVESDSLRAAPLDAAHERPALMAELIEYERDAARLRLNRLAFRHRATEVIEEVVRPVMYDLGDQW